MKIAFVIIQFAFLILCVGCTKKPTYETLGHKRLDPLAKNANKGKGYDRKEKLKNKFEKSLLNFYKGEYKRAAGNFDVTGKELESWYTKSLSELGLSKILNENSKTFRGHYVEHWQWQTLAVINRLAMKDHEGALVELRRLSRSIRKSKDPFSEKRVNVVRRDYLCTTGLLFMLLGRDDEGFADLYQAYRLEQKRYPPELRDTFLNLAHQRMGSNFEGGKALGKGKPFYKAGMDTKVSITLKDQGPEKIEKKISMTMVGIWPIIHDYMSESKEERKVEDIQSIALGVLGKRVITIAYPVFRERHSPSHGGGYILDYNKLLLESWDAQKNRLIGQTALRIVLKLIASVKARQAAKDLVGENELARMLVGNLANLLVWSTEKADVRQILYLPALVEIDWNFAPKKGKSEQVYFEIKRSGIF